jgi:hypothetical protein
MGGYLKRVPLDFDWPIDTAWEGYETPERLREEKCVACDGSGASPHARHLKDRWYGYVPFHPSETGSTPFTPETPEVRAFAERNVDRDPGYYSRGDNDRRIGDRHFEVHDWREDAIVREALRLAEHFNRSWSHHLDQDDVDALIEGNHLWDLTRTIGPDGWEDIVPTPTVTAEQVNRWSILGFGHDSINQWVVARAKCERDGEAYECAVCGGHGSVEKYEGQRAEAEAWEPIEPPEGEGFQLWQNTSEDSPITPVFATIEDLCTYAAENCHTFADHTATAEEWRSMLDDDFVHSTMVNPDTGDSIVFI